MKNLKLFVIAAVVFCASLVTSAQSALALSFTDLITFNITVSYGPFQSSGFSWTHDITDNIGGNLISNIIITDATLSVSHSNAGNGAPSELWNITSAGNLNSTNAFTTSVFNFGPTSLADLQADGLFSAFLSELTAGSDSIGIGTSTLSGNYTVNGTNNPPDPNPNPNTPSSPEPFTAALIASGLGLAAISKRFKK